MKKMDELIRNLLSNRSRPASQRAYVIDSICKNLFKQDDFKKILGQTKLFTVEEIVEIYETSKNWKTNPQALFWKLVKEKRESLMEQLKKEKNVENSESK